MIQVHNQLTFRKGDCPRYRGERGAMMSMLKGLKSRDFPEEGEIPAMVRERKLERNLLSLRPCYLRVLLAREGGYILNHTYSYSVFKGPFYKKLVQWFSNCSHRLTA